MHRMVTCRQRYSSFDVTLTEIGEPTTAAKVIEMSCRLVEGQLHDFQTLELTNNQIALTIIPELGAKIASLQHLPAQREWLWKNPRQAYAVPNFDSSYVESFDLGGIDECFPAVAAGAYPTAPWIGTIIADHGELWSQPWRLHSLNVTDQQIHLTQTCYGLRFPYRFERTLRLVADRAAVELTYHVTNLSPYPFPFIWSIHPFWPLNPVCVLPCRRRWIRCGLTQKSTHRIRCTIGRGLTLA